MVMMSTWIVAMHASGGMRMRPTKLPYVFTTTASAGCTRLGACETTLALSDTSNEVAQWAVDVNERCVEELAAVAREWSPAIEGEWERLASVEIVDVNDAGFEIAEVLCSAQDDRCIAIKVPVDWPRHVSSPAEMAAAFDELAEACTPGARKDALIETAERFRPQDEELARLRNLLSAPFEADLRALVPDAAREMLRPTESLERAQMTQLCYDGFTMQVVSSDLLEAAAAADADAQGIRRRLSEVSVLFESPCASADEVEDQIVAMCMQAVV